ncbi:hypothetical protein PG984_000785 [Apiospora sp. TS-2023a]
MLAFLLALLPPGVTSPMRDARWRQIRPACLICAYAFSDFERAERGQQSVRVQGEETTAAGTIIPTSQDGEMALHDIAVGTPWFATAAPVAWSTSKGDGASTD